MKINILRIILITLLISTFGIIFNFSNQNGNQSGGLSRKVLEKIVEIIPSTKNLKQEEKDQIVENGQPIIRKLAHFSIYTIVGFLLMAILSTYNIKLSKRIINSLIIGIIYASTDEFHQSFIPGRSSEIRDVCIDTLGVILGVIIVIIFLKIYNKNKEKSIDKNNNY